MKFCIVNIIFLLFNFQVFCQLSLTTSSQVNTKCNGQDCNYSGSQVLINEVMLSPSIYDGSLSGEGPGFVPETNEGEWIELYNQDLCDPIDISCFILGNNSADLPNGISENFGGAFVIPAGSIVPPGGFAIIRGIHAPLVPSNLLVQNGGTTIQITVDSNRVCIGGGVRFWLPNSGGWLALYDRMGLPLDAIIWNDYYNACTYCNPCLPFVTDCLFSVRLVAALSC